MSRIIKAADLKVLVVNESQTVIPAIPKSSNSLPSKNSSGGTILDASNLLEDAQRKAAEIVAQASEQAELQRQQLEDELEKVRLQAKESGFAVGYEEGLVEGHNKALQDAGELLGLLKAVVDEGVKLRASNLAALEDDFLKLSLLLADKIVRKTVENDIAWLKPLLRDALVSLGQVDEVVVFLGSIDYSLLQDYGEDLQLETRTKLVFDQDSSITQGGCLIESESGLIDARLESRLGKLAHHLLEVLYYENN